MKRLFILILILLLGWGAWEIYNSRKDANEPPPIKLETAVAHPDPSNATFQFEDGPITLKKGVATTNVTPGGEITQDTTLTDTVAYGDINNDNKNDTAIILVQEGSGSGVFFYVAAYVSGVVQYKGSNSVFLGDRVSPKSISIDKGVITVTYLDRKPDEPFTNEPTVLTTKHYSYTNGELVEE